MLHNIPYLETVGGIMERQDINDLPASKGDIQMVLDAIREINDFGIETPEDPSLLNLWKRLDQIETVTKKVAGMGLSDIPIDAETAAAITGLAIGTVKNYGSYGHVDTIRIGKKLQFSLKGCITLVERGAIKAFIDCTTEISGYHRKKRGKRHGKEKQTNSV
jgi:hypothetical protein